MFRRQRLQPARDTSSLKHVRRYLFAATACSAAVLVAVACGTDDGGSTFTNGVDSGSDGSDNGSGGGFGEGGPGDNGDGGDNNPNATGVLTAVIRDFRKWNGDAAASNPDFEDITAALDQAQGAISGVSESTRSYWPYTTSDGTQTNARFECDIVGQQLDDAGVPLYTAAACDAGAGKTYTTHGKAFFDEWYRDVPGRNIHREIPITLTPNGAGAYTYDSAVVGVALADAAAPGDDPTHKEFFPIDDGTDASTAFGNEGDAHNYSFTVELRTTFKYKGTETFKFSGDDDVFVFINHKLVINIGGIHQALTKTINVADFAAAAGLTVGGTYNLDFFQAERHKTESNLRIETTLDLKAPIILK